jgi:hypothetical protein
MEQLVTFEGGKEPAWPEVQELLSGCGFAVQVRMIDGQLAFPDEIPPPAWGELRLGTPLGMVTVRREPGQVRVVTWGNADDALRRAWNALAWAFAEAGAGVVHGDRGDLAAGAFRKAADLPADLAG